MSKKTREDKKLRKYSRKETERFFDNPHSLPFRARFKIAMKLLFGRKAKKGE